MEWLLVILVLIIIGLFEGRGNSDNSNSRRRYKHSAPPPSSAPKAKADWRQQEANNEFLRETDPLKARGDGYELHIGRMFERKGDLVIYNGLLRGYDDQGVDLIVISKNDQSVNLVQCKHWKRYEFTTEHLLKIYNKLSRYRRDYAELQPEAISHYLALSFTHDEIKKRIQLSAQYPLRKTLYLASNKVMTVDVHSQLTPLRDNIYRHKDMKIVISEIG